MIPILRDRIVRLSDLGEMEREGELGFFFKAPDYEAKELLWKGKGESSSAAGHLRKIKEIVDSLGEEFSAEEAKSTVWPYAEEAGRGDVLWPMRYSLSGKERSPDPFVIASTLGKTETLKRLETAIEKLETNV